MLIEILRTTVCDGRRVEAGDVIDATERSGTYLIAIRKAQPAAVTRNVADAALPMVEQGRDKPKPKKGR